MDELDRRFAELVASEAFAPSPVEQVRAVWASRPRSRQLGAVAVVILLTAMTAAAVRVRSGGTTGVSIGAPQGTVPPATSFGGYWDCHFASFWDVVESETERIRNSDGGPARVSPIVVGRMGHEISRTTSLETRVDLAIETTLSSFETWRVLFPSGLAVSIDSVSSKRIDVPGTASTCDQTSYATQPPEGQVVVSYVSDNTRTPGSWWIGSRDDALFYAVRTDGTPPQSPSELDGTVSIQTADHRPACRQHETCSLAELQQEIDALALRR